MSTPDQIAATQANAKLQRGQRPTPVSTSRARIPQNVHSQEKANPALPGEHDAVEVHVQQGYFRNYAPLGLPEQDLVRDLAENNWRLQRARPMERL